MWGGGVPSPLEEGSGEGQSPPQKIFLVFDLKMVNFGAFWRDKFKVFP